MLRTPVVLIVYQRIDNLATICEAVRKIKPQEIFVIADGPKNAQEKILTDQVRAKLEELIDWPCHVHKNYAKTNLGLKERFRTGIDWVFRHTDRAIFLEDDCIPDPTFFKFCGELLKKYQDDERIMTISGNNFQFGKLKLKSSYYFSKYPHVWGWATWKRAWELYDSQIADWPTRRNTSWLKDVTQGFVISKFWKYIFDRLTAGKINTWDYQLTYASLKNHGLNITPAVNLVTNVGYGSDSTNIKRQNQTVNVPAAPMKFPLVHPRTYAVDHAADHRIENLVYLHPLGKLSLVVKSILGIL